MQFPSNHPFTPTPRGQQPWRRGPRRGGWLALLLVLLAGAAAVGRSHGSSKERDSQKQADQPQDQPQDQPPAQARAAQAKELPRPAAADELLEYPRKGGASAGEPHVTNASAKSASASSTGAVRLLADAAYASALDELMAGATRSIDVTMFSCVLPAEAKATHAVRKILDRLVRVSKSGVRVRVVFDQGIPAHFRKDGVETPSENGAQYLAERGVEVRWDEDARTTHSKSLVVDGRWCIIGSTNWSYSALHKNREQSVLIDNNLLASELTTHFEALWRLSNTVSAKH